MAISIEKEGKTVQQAINDALEELQVSAEDVLIEVLDEGESGLLGIGRRPARVKVTFEDEVAAAGPPRSEIEDQVYYGDDEDYTGDPETPEEAETTAYIAAILSGIGIHGKLSSFKEKDTLYVDVTGQDCGAAIGHHGETLEAIQYLATLVANKHSQDRVRVILDIGDYRRRRENTLISLADRTAERVLRSGRPQRLKPMKPAERRIIHSSLQDFAGVTTFSEGEDPRRCVVIAPADRE